MLGPDWPPGVARGLAGVFALAPSAAGWNGSATACAAVAVSSAGRRSAAGVPPPPLFSSSSGLGLLELPGSASAHRVRATDRPGPFCKVGLTSPL